MEGARGTISHFTCAHTSTDSRQGGVGGVGGSHPEPMMCKPFLTSHRTNKKTAHICARDCFYYSHCGSLSPALVTDAGGGSLPGGQ